MPGYTLSDGLTLKTKLGSHDEEIEAECVASRELDLRFGLGPAGHLDAEHLKAIHQHLFQDVFEWAGHTRDERVTLSDGATAYEPTFKKPGGRAFLSSEQIPAALDDFTARLKEADYLRGLPREAFAEKAADLMSDLNGIHPFREGNGRTQRLFMELVAERAGHSLDFRATSGERMVQASIAAHENDNRSEMRRLFSEACDPERVEMLRAAINGLEKHGFKWNEQYIATLEPGQTVELRLAGIAGDQFMARGTDRILVGKATDLPRPPPERNEVFTVTATPYRERQQGPLTANEVLARHGRPDLQARYEAQEQRREQTARSASPVAETARQSGQSRGDTPPEKQQEKTAAEQRRDRLLAQFTTENPDFEHAREHDNSQGGGRGGRGRSK